jgi:hypothetical protein
MEVAATSDIGQDIITLRGIICCFAEWAALKHNKKFLGTESIGLVSLLLAFFSVPELTEPCYIFFVNCALEGSNHAYFLSEKLGLSSFIRRQMINEEEQVTLLSTYPFWFFTNMIATIDPLTPNLSLYLDYRIHEIFYHRLLSEGNNPLFWRNRHQGIAYRCLFSLFYLSIYEEGAKAIQELPGLQNYLESLIAYNFREKIPASIILCNMIDSNEDSHSLSCTPFMYSVQPERIEDETGNSTCDGRGNHSILERNPDILSLLFMVFTANLFYNSSYLLVAPGNLSTISSFSSSFASPSAFTSPSTPLCLEFIEKAVNEYRHLGYNYGIFKLHSIVGTLRKLASSSPVNCSILLSQHVILFPLLLKCLSLFYENSPECCAVGIYYGITQHAGGGGDDYETLEYIIELLLHLVFFCSSQHCSARVHSEEVMGNNENNSTGSIAKDVEEKEATGDKWNIDKLKNILLSYHISSDDNAQHDDDGSELDDDAADRNNTNLSSRHNMLSLLSSLLSDRQNSRKIRMLSMKSYNMIKLLLDKLDV